jgi:cytochrome P450
MSQWVTHHDPRWFDDPWAFNPERWRPDASGLELEKRIPRYAYYPFGGGPRICIGQPFAMMEMQVVLPMILQRYGFSLLPGHEVVPEPLITLRQRHGLMTQIHARQREFSHVPYGEISQTALA